MCIDLMVEMKKLNKKVGFIFALANEKYNKEYLGELRTTINSNAIDSDFLFLIGQKQLWPLFSLVDLLVRPTNTDGDAISIREALYFNCKVLASDVVSRLKSVYTVIPLFLPISA